MGNMFPPDWEVSERIAVAFCDITRKDLEKLMFKRKHELDTKLLLHAIQKTVNFESLLSRRFPGVTLDQYQQELHDRKEKESKVGGKLSAFTHCAYSFKYDLALFFSQFLFLMFLQI